MRYADYRHNIQSGDILAWSHRTSWFNSWYDFKINFVRLWRRSEYTHVGLAWVVGGRVMVIESTKPLARIVPLSNLLPCYWITGDGLSDDELERALSLIGKAEYSEIEAMKASFGENIQGDAKWECAELVAWVKQYDVQATPDALVEFMLERGSTLKYLSD